MSFFCTLLLALTELKKKGVSANRHTSRKITLIDDLVLSFVFFQTYICLGRQTATTANMAASHSTKRKFSSERAKGYYQLNDAEPKFAAEYLGMILVDELFQPEKGQAISARCVDKLSPVMNRKRKERKVSLLISSNISRGITVTEIPNNEEVC